MKIKITGIFFVLLIVIFVTGCDKNSQSNVNFNGFTQVGSNDYQLDVNNDVSVYNFSDSVTTFNGYTWDLCADITGLVNIPSKTVNLDVGNNIYYIIIKKDSKTEVYTVNVYRLSVFIVSFNLNGGMPQVKDMVVQEKDIITPPTNIVKLGYKFNGWDYDFSKPIDHSFSATAKYELETYTIRYVLNGGINNDNNVSYYTFESDTILFYSPIKKGSIFDGWYDENEYFENAVTRIETGSYGNKTIYAKWTAVFDIDSIGNCIIDDVDDLNFLSHYSELWSWDYILKNDIDVGSINWLPIGNYETAFTGKFFGNKHKISNMKITYSALTTNSFGFFGFARNASIIDLYIDDIDIEKFCNSSAYMFAFVGGIVGYADCCEIKNCYTSGNISFSSSTTGTYIGGIAGQYNGLIENSFSLCALHGFSITNTGTDFYIGGCIGGVLDRDLIIKNCYFNNQISSSTSGNDTFSGGIVGNVIRIATAYTPFTITIKDCFVDSSIQAEVSPVATITTSAIIASEYVNIIVANCYYSEETEQIAQFVNGESTGCIITQGLEKSMNDIWALVYSSWDDTIWNLYLDRNPTLKDMV